MFEDIQKSIDLEPNGAPNMLIAMGLSCYTEYWGKLLRGIAIGESQKCYEEFLRYLGKMYNPNPYNKLLGMGLPVYEDIRCGLVHAYGTNEDCTVYMGEGKFGICYDVIKGHYDFNIKTYFKEFKHAVNEYIQGLNNGTRSILNLNKAMKGKPLIG
jgi:hypothetical protein